MTDKEISKTMGYWSEQFGDCYPEKTAKVKSLIEQALQTYRDSLRKKAVPANQLVSETTSDDGMGIPLDALDKRDQ